MKVEFVITWGHNFLNQCSSTGLVAFNCMDGGTARKGRQSCTSYGASPRDLPKHQPNGIDISPLEGFKVFHVYGVVQDLWSHVPVMEKKSKQTRSCQFSRRYSSPFNYMLLCFKCTSMQRPSHFNMECCLGITFHHHLCSLKPNLWSSVDGHRHGEPSPLWQTLSEHLSVA